MFSLDLTGCLHTLQTLPGRMLSEAPCLSCGGVLYCLGFCLFPPLCSLTPELSRYTQNGILHMLDRNKRIKTRPERFQSCKEKFDLVITCEERVYDQVLEGEAFTFNVNQSVCS